MSDNYCVSERQFPCGEQIVHVTPTTRAQTKAFKTKKGERYVLCDGKKALAQITTMFTDEEDTMATLVNWKSMVPGHGYGRQLLTCVLDSKPKLSALATDGFSELGMINFKKAAKNFVIIEHKRGYQFSWAMAWRQEAVDAWIEKQEKVEKRGKILFWHLDPKLHSKYKKK
jgi:hypothetical protein